jgi:hypothetical protein
MKPSDELRRAIVCDLQQEPPEQISLAVRSLH